MCLIGANGAGKTTLLRAISGVQPIRSGRIFFDNEPIERCSAAQRVARGIAQSPEGRQVFAPMSIEENLRLGAYSQGARDDHSTGGTECECGFECFEPRLCHPNWNNRALGPGRRTI